MSVCHRCVMDVTATDWFPTKSGCNYCDEFVFHFPNLSSSKHFTDAEIVENMDRLKVKLEKNKKRGSNQQYDCVIGLSGGLDSSYALYLAAENGINPLVVHMDNGWNSELAQNNIEGLINHFGFDFESYVIDWEEYRDLQKSFLAADVVDIEMLYDMAAVGVCFQAARRHKIFSIVAGTNLATEGMRMPPTWSYRNKLDKKNLMDIVKKHGENITIDTFPLYSSYDQAADLLFRKIDWISILDLVNYSKKGAEEKLVEKFGFKPYPFKHYESVFTRFYQGYLLPMKFGIDKRKSHLSTLIMTGQLKRDKAIELLGQSPYPTQEQLDGDMEYFLKRMEWSKNDLENYLMRPPRSHDSFASDDLNIRFLKFIYFTTRAFYFGVRRTVARVYFGVRRTVARVYFGVRRTVARVYFGVRRTVARVYFGVRRTVARVYFGVRTFLFQSKNPK
jgi:N-acetyl sugar amidotransferase